MGNPAAMQKSLEMLSDYNDEPWFRGGGGGHLSTDAGGRSFQGQYRGSHGASFEQMLGGARTVDLSQTPGGGAMAS